MIIKLIIIDDRLTDRGIADSVVDHRIHRHRHRVLGQHLLHQDISVSFKCVEMILT